MDKEKVIKEAIFNEMKESFMSSFHYDDYSDLRDVLLYVFGIDDAYDLDIESIIKSMELKG